MSASAAAGGAAAPNPAFDSHFASVFSACTSEGLGGDLKFVDAFFSFLRRNTKLLQAPQAVEQVQAIAVKHVEIAKKQAKADATAAAAKKAAEAKQASDKAAAASASAASSASSSSSSAAPASASASVTSLPDAADKPDAEDALPTPIDNGGRTDKYVWTQTLSEVNVSIVLPAGTTSKLLSVSIEPNALHASLKKGDKTVYLSGEPDERIDSNNATWTLETDKAGVKLLQLYLPKLNKMSWWKCVVKGDPCINTKKIVPENSKLEDLDGDTRSTVEKMMFDQRQKQMGKPSSDEITKQNALKRFMEMHPEMDFSNVRAKQSSAPHTHTQRNSRNTDRHARRIDEQVQRGSAELTVRVRVFFAAVWLALGSFSSCNRPSYRRRSEKDTATDAAGGAECALAVDPISLLSRSVSLGC